jgi:hypothetical protein
VLLSTIVGQPSASDLFERRQELVAARRAAGMGAPVDAAGVAKLVGAAAVQRIEFDSVVTPAWSYDPSAPARPGSDWFMRATKPVFRIVPTVGEPIEYAPYGRPDPKVKALVAVGAAAATVVGGVAFLGLVAKALGKPRQENPRRRRRRARR